MTYHRRRRSKPSQYRFLLELKPAFVAVALAAFLNQILDLPCTLAILGKLQSACRVEVPAYVWWGLLAAVIYGVCACFYRYYRDFHLGEYHRDLEER